MRSNLDDPRLTNPTLLGRVSTRYQIAKVSEPIALNTFTTVIDNSGATAHSMADGVDGQLKSITMKTFGGNAVVTPDNLLGGTTLTLNNVGDTILLQFILGSWSIIYNLGVEVA